MQQLPKRLLSIDVLRAITMFLMIFVNDASGVRHIPEWIDHAKGFEDRMGFADTIFPAFMFIVGLSLPLAINSRIKKGDNTWDIIYYILSRSAALLIMGFFHVNLESISSQTAINRDLWALLITIAFFLVWLDYPETLAKSKKKLLSGLGMVILFVMAYYYRGEGRDGVLRGMAASWWGILGLIGWSYLVCALVYFAVKGNLKLLILMWVVFAAVNIVSHTTTMRGLWVIHDGSMVTLTMGGIVISGIYAKLVEIGKTNRLWAILAVIGVLLLVAGFAVRPYAEGISKIRSTPAWIFICSGITTLMFLILVYLVDFKGKINAFKWIKPAGTSTLTCYLIPYLQYALFGLIGIDYPHIFNVGYTGLLRCALTALLIILLVGQMEKIKLRLKV